MPPRNRRSGGPSKSELVETDEKVIEAATEELEEAKTDAAEREPAEKGDGGGEKATGDSTRGPGDTDAEAGPVDNVERAGEQLASSTPETERTEGGNGAGEGATMAQQAVFTDTLHLPGDPVPDEVDMSMVRPETGLSPEVAEHDTTHGVVPTAPTGDTERNGKATAIPTDTSGELRHAEGAVPTAAFGQDARNGHATGMAAEGQIGTDFGGNGDSVARLVADGVRGEQGVGTANPDIGPDERPTYPSTTLTRATPDAAPMEPEDVTHATEPKLGDVQGSLDPTMAAAGMPSMAGDVTVDLVDENGTSVKPSGFFETPEGLQARSFRRVNCRVSEVFTVRKVATPSRRLLFTKGQLVDIDVAQTLIRLHG
jgi:hypothetical protein